jgi:hypothetical protein
MRYFSTFSGIGGFELGIQNAYDHISPTCIGYSEIDSTASSIYQYHWPDQINYGDIRTINPIHLPDFDLLVGGFPCQPSQLLESVKDLPTSEVLFSLKSLGLLGKSNHAFYCLKTSKAYYLTTKGRHSLPSLSRWMNWGMTSNGKCLTAKISAFPKTGSGCTLWDIIEVNPDRKYFLSEKQKQFITKPERLKKGYARLHLQPDNLPVGMETISK